MDGPGVRKLDVSVGLIQDHDAGAAPPRLGRPSPTAPTTSSGSTTCATTWPCGSRTGPAGDKYAIVDEVDSILIDEARTPLIISGMVADTAKWYQMFARIAPRLRATRTTRWRAKRTVAVTEAGVDRVEESSASRTCTSRSTRRSCTTCRTRSGQGAVQAGRRLHRHQGEVKIVDEFTGRILEGRATPRASTRRSRPRRASGSRRRTRRSPRSRSRTTSACTTSWPA